MKKFLEHILAQTGYYCLAVQRQKTDGTGKYFVHKAFSNLDDLQKEAKKLKKHVDIYYCVGTLKETKDENGKTRRTHNNISHFKSFFLDLDCGKNKDYATKDEALIDLKRFSKELGLPRPTIVDSGGGIHCYWTLKKEITSDIWFKIARRFKLVSEHMKLKADPSRTSDMSSVLRVPDTYNHKLSKLREVKVLCYSNPMKLDDFILPIKNYLDSHPEISVPVVKPPTIYSEFEDISKRTDYDVELIYNNCDQMAYVRAVGGPVGYQMRASAVSIIKLTKQQDYSVLVANDDNPEVVESQTDTQTKDSITANPHTCERFESGNPGGCDKCKLKGIIKSPIRIEAALQKPPTVSEYQAMPPEQKEKVKQVLSDKVKETPECPKNYVFQTKFGTTSLYGEAVNDEGTKELVKIFDGVIYPTEVHSDSDTRKEVVTVYIAHGQDDPKTVQIHSVDLTDSKSLAKVLSSYGVLLHENQKGLMRSFMIAWLERLKQEQKSTLQMNQFGWTKDHESFVMSDKAVKIGGEEYKIQLGETIRALSDRFGKAGTLEGWREAIDTYGKKGSEKYAFAHLSGYGSLLLEMTQLSGGLLSIKGDSGSGKSTLLDSIDTIWGPPKNYMKKADSLAARDIMLGGYNSRCGTFDELTNLNADLLSEWIYTFTQGAGKNTATQTRTIRENKSTWKMFGVLTTNLSLVQRLASSKADASAEIYRLVEYNIDLNDQYLSKSDGDETFSKLGENYGHAGPIFVDFLVKNYEKVKAKLIETQRYIDEDLKIKTNERYWSAIVACNFVAGMYAKNLGLHNFDMEAVYNWSKEMVNDMRGQSKDSVKDAKSLLSDYIASNVGTTLIIDKYGEHSIPRAEIHSRFDTEVGKLYISKEHFRKYINRAGGDIVGVLKSLEKDNVVLNSNGRIVLTKGTSLPSSGQVYCVVVDAESSAMRGINLEEVKRKAV